MPTTISGDTGVSQIQDGVVSTADLANGAVTQGKLASNVAGNGPAFRATLSGAQSYTPTAWAKVNFNTETFDTNNNFDSTTNYRFTPTVAGYYFINLNVQYAASSGMTAAYASIYKNGAFVEVNFGGVASAASAARNVSGLIYLNGSTDYVEGYASTVGGVTVTISTTSSFSGFLARSA